MLDDAERCWRALRAMRSQPPGWAGRGERRAAFDAGLSQGEDLWRAARGLPPQSSPIVIFYALMQGAKAVAAATAQRPDWRGAPAHGLRLDRPAVGATAVPTLSDLVVRPAGRGFIHLIADTMSSATLTTASTLDAIACSLPEQATFGLNVPDAKRPLEVRVWTAGPEEPAAAALAVSPLPPALHRPVHEGSYTRMNAPATAELRDWLLDYPSLAALGEPSECRQVSPLLDAHGGYSAVLVWPLAEPLTIFEKYAWAEDVLDVVDARPYGPTSRSGSGLALPSVAGNGQSQAPLIAWWTLLYAFSMLARYHPATWTSLLDVRRSQPAVPVEGLLSTAIDVIPRYLLQALVSAQADEAADHR